MSTIVKPYLPESVQVKRKRVAAYTRVSSAKDTMLNSLSNQVHAYSSMIQANPEWEYVGVYIDEGITGTKEERPGFQQMMADCRDGKRQGICSDHYAGRFGKPPYLLLFQDKIL